MDLVGGAAVQTSCACIRLNRLRGCCNTASRIFYVVESDCYGLLQLCFEVLVTESVGLIIIDCVKKEFDKLGFIELRYGSLGHS